VSAKTYDNWEQGKHEPEVMFLPAVIAFLGYDPYPVSASLSERILAARRRQGISQRELARRLGLDPTTVQAWEKGKVLRRYPRLVRLFEEYVESA
jgi:DNA-binding transcriptional regulator YiaG